MPVKRTGRTWGGLFQNFEDGVLLIEGEVCVLT